MFMLVVSNNTFLKVLVVLCLRKICIFHLILVIISSRYQIEDITISFIKDRLLALASGFIVVIL